MLNKVKYKTRCKCMRKEEEKKRSIHGDNTNVLMKEFTVDGKMLLTNTIIKKEFLHP